MQELRDKLIERASALLDKDNPGPDDAAAVEAYTKAALGIDQHVTTLEREKRYDERPVAPPSCGVSPDDFLKLKKEVNELLQTAKRKKVKKGGK